MSLGKSAMAGSESLLLCNWYGEVDDVVQNVLQERTQRSEKMSRLSHSFPFKREKEGQARGGLRSHRGGPDRSWSLFPHLASDRIG